METNAKLMNQEQAETEISKAEFKLMPKREVKAWIGRIKEAVANLDEEIKQCMLQCLAHAKTHGDVTLIEELADSLPEGRWNNGFRQWLYRNSPIRAREDGTMHQLKKDEKGFKEYNLEAASTEDPLPKAKTGNNRKERSFSLVDILSIPATYRKRMAYAKKEGFLVEPDEKRMDKALTAVEATLTDLNMKPSKRIEVSEDQTKKAKPRLISKKTVQAKAKSAKAA